ncbi:MAG: UDP-N-acetyl-D-glucosamine dehydrogenase [Rhodospirillaceae bacterium]|nr:MAG: UDP-N-acetyl-D-glucosamine dehydrogenase [Rhodospirillaceae bacterium]
MEKIRTAVIGVGYFGKFHADKYAGLALSEFTAVADSDPARAREIAEKHGVSFVSDYRDLLGKVDAVSIAVPTPFHYEVAKAFLENGVHVLIEKPITGDLAEADELIRLAAENGLVLQVGHLERFSAARLGLEGVINRPLFIECNRIAAFKPRGTDVSVTLDMMIHDIDMIQYLVKSPISEVDAAGAPVFSGEEDIVNARLHFENGCIANVTASRISMKNERKMRIFQHDAYLMIDFVNKKVVVARKGEGESLPGVPKIDVEEHTYEDEDILEREIDAFLKSIAEGRPPLVSGEDGRHALETALLINESLKLHASRSQALGAKGTLPG